MKKILTTGLVVMFVAFSTVRAEAQSRLAPASPLRAASVKVEELLVTNSVHGQTAGELQVTLSGVRAGKSWQPDINVEFGLTPAWQMELGLTPASGDDAPEFHFGLSRHWVSRSTLLRFAVGAEGERTFRQRDADSEGSALVLESFAVAAYDVPTALRLHVFGEVSLSTDSASTHFGGLIPLGRFRMATEFGMSKPFSGVADTLRSVTLGLITILPWDLEVALGQTHVFGKPSARETLLKVTREF